MHDFQYVKELLSCNAHYMIHPYCLVTITVCLSKQKSLVKVPGAASAFSKGQVLQPLALLLKYA
jgi:hypothetical protein